MTHESDQTFRWLWPLPRRLDAHDPAPHAHDRTPTKREPVPRPSGWTIREVSTWPDHIEYIECSKCGSNATSGSPSGYQCRLCGAPAYRRTRRHEQRPTQQSCRLDPMRTTDKT